jgi:hypothetical protein
MAPVTFFSASLIITARARKGARQHSARSFLPIKVALHDKSRCDSMIGKTGALVGLRQKRGLTLSGQTPFLTEPRARFDHEHSAEWSGG